MCAGVRRRLQPGRCTSVYISLPVHLILLFLPTDSFFVISALMGSAESPITPQLRVCIRCVRLILKVWAQRVIFVCVPLHFHLPDAVATLCPQRARLRCHAISQTASKSCCRSQSPPITPRFTTFSANGLLFCLMHPLPLSGVAILTFPFEHNISVLVTYGICKTLRCSFILKDNSTNCTHYSVFTGLWKFDWVFEESSIKPSVASEEAEG